MLRFTAVLKALLLNCLVHHIMRSQKLTVQKDLSLVLSGMYSIGMIFQS
uniref:Uncharacterized protein n=1 Tax=Arundo donax TaxID=35708 RepID=A0A0A9CVZ9_ARUDO